MSQQRYLYNSHWLIIIRSSLLEQSCQLGLPYALLPIQPTASGQIPTMTLFPDCHAVGSSLIIESLLVMRERRQAGNHDFVAVHAPRKRGSVDQFGDFGKQAAQILLYSFRIQFALNPPEKSVAFELSKNQRLGKEGGREALKQEE